MYREKPIRDREGNIVKAASFQSKDVPEARIEPSRRWFSNTRVIGQDTLSEFRERLQLQAKDPYSVLLRRNKLPMSLLLEPKGPTEPRAQVVETEPFNKTFGPKSQRKRARVKVDSLMEIATAVETEQAAFTEKEAAKEPEDSFTRSIEPREKHYEKGQSRRIWNELYKVVDSSDVVIHVLDARDPQGTRCRAIELYLKNDAPHKHLIFILNKCDLVPTWVAVSFFIF